MVCIEYIILQNQIIMENLIKVIATEWHYVVICIYSVFRELFRIDSC